MVTHRSTHRSVYRAGPLASSAAHKGRHQNSRPQEHRNSGASSEGQGLVRKPEFLRINGRRRLIKICTRLNSV